MPEKKLIFLSHVHEEKDLAVLMQTALELEFSGFVEIFVSSDGKSIPAGANFLTRIEEGLVGCCAAIYLISPKSVSRNWVNFELGAVWVRNAQSIRAGQAVIPAIPFCHSGMVPSTLPAPLNNLNGILAHEASQLQFAFQSLQAAVGGKGPLRTDFDALATKVSALEASYTTGASLRAMLKLLSLEPEVVLAKLSQHTLPETVLLKLGFRETSVVSQVRAMAEGELKAIISGVSVDKAGVSFFESGAVNGAELAVNVLRKPTIAALMA